VTGVQTCALPICIAPFGDDLTVTAVAEGRDAAEDIHKALIG